MYKNKLRYVLTICICMTLFGMVYTILIAFNHPMILMTGMWGVFAGFFLNEYINIDNDDDSSL